MSARLRCFALVPVILLASPLLYAQGNTARLLADLQSPDPGVRDVAVQQLGKSKSARAVKPLIEALNDTNLRVSSDAATALGELHAVSAVPALIDALRHPSCGSIVESNPRAAAALSTIGLPAVPAMVEALTHSTYGISDSISRYLEPALDNIHSAGVVPLLIPLLSSANPRVRGYVALRLQAHPDPRAVTALLPLLNDPDKYVLWQVVMALSANMNDPRVLPALKEVADTHVGKSAEDSPGQLHAINVLGKLHDPSLIPIFIDGLEYPAIGENEASAALMALGPVTIPALIAALADENRPATLRQWAAITLGQFHDPRVAPALLAATYARSHHTRLGVLETAVVNTDPLFTDRLLEMLASDKFEQVRQYSAESLAKHDDPRVNPALIAALKDRDENVRDAAATALGKRHDVDALPTLVDYMHGKTTLDHQGGAQALGMLGDDRAVVPLMEMLARPNSGDCYPVSEALATLAKTTRDPEFYSRLRETLAKPNSSHCGPAMALLSRDPGSAWFVTQRLSETHDDNGNTPAFEVLDASKGKPGVEATIAALSSPDAATRAHAAKALGANQRGDKVDPRAIEPLLGLLDDPDEEVRRTAAISLINVDDVRKIEPFSRMIRSHDFAMREYSASALGQVHDPRAVTPLIAALGDPDFNTRRGVLGALQHSSYPPVLTALLAALRSPDANVREGAALALRYRTEPGVTKALIPLAHDPDPNVVKAVQQALSACPPPPLMD